MTEDNPWAAAAEEARKQDEDDVTVAGLQDDGDEDDGEGWVENIEEAEAIERPEEPDLDELNFQLDGRAFDATVEAAEAMGMTPEELIEAALKRYLREGRWL